MLFLLVLQKNPIPSSLILLYHAGNRILHIFFLCVKFTCTHTHSHMKHVGTHAQTNRSKLRNSYRNLSLLVLESKQRQTVTCQHGKYTSCDLFYNARSESDLASFHTQFIHNLSLKSCEGFPTDVHSSVKAMEIH